LKRRDLQEIGDRSQESGVRSQESASRRRGAAGTGDGRRDSVVERRRAERDELLGLIADQLSWRWADDRPWRDRRNGSVRWNADRGGPDIGSIPHAAVQVFQDNARVDLRQEAARESREEADGRRIALAARSWIGREGVAVLRARL
jgi:hypothetical protein